jgi:L-ascorbate metabolism protein UlaG (beta-lactamase superfamily)
MWIMKPYSNLKTKVGKVICGLGVGAHFEHWGYATDKIVEVDWGDTVELEDGFVVHATPARHFSGRTFAKNKTLWLSMFYTVQNENIYWWRQRYDKHFAEIGKAFGPIDLAILDNGQYDMGGGTFTCYRRSVEGSQDLNANVCFRFNHPVLFGNHPWNEPLAKITELNRAPDCR